MFIINIIERYNIYYAIYPAVPVESERTPAGCTSRVRAHTSRLHQSSQSAHQQAAPVESVLTPAGGTSRARAHTSRRHRSSQSASEQAATVGSERIPVGYTSQVRAAPQQAAPVESKV